MKFRVEFGFAENAMAVEEWQTMDGLDVVEAESAEGAANFAACTDGLENALFRVYPLRADQFGGLEKAGKPEFYSFYDEPERQTLEIYCNYGVLAAEKRNVYTYGAQHYNATCSDRMTVYVPEGWAAWDNPMGKTMVTAPWGWDYEVGEVLAGDKYPHFEAKDRDGNLRRYRLDGELHGDGVEDEK